MSLTLIARLAIIIVFGGLAVMTTPCVVLDRSFASPSFNGFALIGLNFEYYSKGSITFTFHFGNRRLQDCNEVNTPKLSLPRVENLKKMLLALSL